MASPKDLGVIFSHTIEENEQWARLISEESQPPFSPVNLQSKALGVTTSVIAKTTSQTILSLLLAASWQS